MDFYQIRAKFRERGIALDLIKVVDTGIVHLYIRGLSIVLSDVLLNSFSSELTYRSGGCHCMLVIRFCALEITLNNRSATIFERAVVHRMVIQNKIVNGFACLLKHSFKHYFTLL